MSQYQMKENFMTTWDQTKLFYRSWLPQQKTKKAVIYFHRGHEHSGRYQHLVDDLNLKDFSFFAWDARGNGNSPGTRDYADSFSVYVKDADTFVKYISQKYEIPIENIVIVAHSVGAVIASTWVHDYAPQIKALVLGTPAFRIKLYIPFAIPMCRLAYKLGLMKTVPSYVKAKVLTHDPEKISEYDKDNKITHSISTNILLDCYDTATRIISDAGAIRVPTLVMGAGSDWVVQLAPQKKFFDNLSSEIKEMVVFPIFFHAIFHEKDRQLPIQKTREFIQKIFSENPKTKPLVNADESSYSKSEYDRLSKPSFSLWYLIQKIILHTMGRLSKGIRIGWKAGFDSGVTLDYVYKNKTHGFPILGTMADRSYLDSIGWKGIRQRRLNMQKILNETVQKLHKEGIEPRLVDIASGPGRYILTMMKENPDLPISATLRDYQKINVEAGQKLASEMNISKAKFEQADAFDEENLSQLSPKPTIGIISGLFELFPSNEPIKKALRGLGKAIDQGGYLIYTNQPWHPQVEYIARVLPNREGNPWVMRCRTQEEMDDLVRSVGFEKIDMEIDQWGIFTVSVAKRINK